VFKSQITSSLSGITLTQAKLNKVNIKDSFAAVLKINAALISAIDFMESFRPILRRRLNAPTVVAILTLAIPENNLSPQQLAQRVSSNSFKPFLQGALISHGVTGVTVIYVSAAFLTNEPTQAPSLAPPIEDPNAHLYVGLAAGMGVMLLISVTCRFMGRYNKVSPDPEEIANTARTSTKAAIRIAPEPQHQPQEVRLQEPTAEPKVVWL